LTAELTIVHPIDQSASDNFVIPVNFTEALRHEISAAINGSGTSWSDRAFGIRVSVAEPQMLAKDMLLTAVRISAGYTEGI
jgi:hypothetical protein